MRGRRSRPGLIDGSGSTLLAPVGHSVGCVHEATRARLPPDARKRKVRRDLSLSQAADQTGLSRTLIYREIERGHLRAYWSQASPAGGATREAGQGRPRRVQVPGESSAVNGQGHSNGPAPRGEAVTAKARTAADTLTDSPVSLRVRANMRVPIAASGSGPPTLAVGEANRAGEMVDAGVLALRAYGHNGLRFSHPIGRLPARHDWLPYRLGLAPSSPPVGDTAGADRPLRQRRPAGGRGRLGSGCLVGPLLPRWVSITGLSGRAARFLT